MLVFCSIVVCSALLIALIRAKVSGPRLAALATGIIVAVPCFIVYAGMILLLANAHNHDPFTLPNQSAALGPADTSTGGRNMDVREQARWRDPRPRGLHSQELGRLPHELGRLPEVHAPVGSGRGNRTVER